jgi:transposase
LKHLHFGLSYKRLEKGRFRWPPVTGGQARVVLSHEELALLLGGIDLAGSRRRAWYRKVVPVESEPIMAEKRVAL